MPRIERFLRLARSSCRPVIGGQTPPLSFAASAHRQRHARASLRSPGGATTPRPSNGHRPRESAAKKNAPEASVHGTHRFERARSPGSASGGLRPRSPAAERITARASVALHDSRERQYRDHHDDKSDEIDNLIHGGSLIGCFLPNLTIDIAHEDEEPHSIRPRRNARRALLAESSGNHLMSCHAFERPRPHRPSSGHLPADLAPITGSRKLVP